MALGQRRRLLLARCAILAGGLTLAVAPALAVGSPQASAGASKRAEPHARKAHKGARAAVTLQRTKLGLVLAAADGRTLYVFLRDQGGKSSCYGSCAKAWPPLTKSGGRLVAGRGVRGRLLGTTRRREGRLQIAYDHHPLYTFSGDSAPREVNGEGIESFGGRWYAISASGSLVKPRHSGRRG
jgi:predicted lipoprotein with Yx(FWY)xxD motif